SEFYFTQEGVAVKTFFFTLAHTHTHHRLVIPCGRERARHLARDRAVSLNQLIRITANDFYSERERCDINEQRTTGCSEHRLRHACGRMWGGCGRVGKATRRMRLEGGGDRILDRRSARSEGCSRLDPAAWSGCIRPRGNGR